MRETKLTRRSFLKGLAAGVATVAIATKMAPRLPMSELKFVAHERYATAWTDARAAYGTALAKSMEQTKERIGANILNKAFGGPSYEHKVYETQELLLDDNEGAVHLISDGNGWYVQAEADRLLDELPWEPKHLKAEHLADYLEALNATS